MTASTTATTDLGPGPHGKPLDEEVVRRTLTMVLDRALAAAPDAEYRFGGTASSVLRGIRMPAGDLDILLKDRSEVDRFGAAVLELPATVCVFGPALTDQPRQYFARYAVDGVTVELSTVEVETDSDAMECFGSGPWTHFDLVPCGSHQVPAVATELRLITELTRDRPERVGPLLEYLRQRGCDVALVRRGMTARRIPDARQAQVLGCLADVDSRSSGAEAPPISAARPRAHRGHTRSVAPGHDSTGHGPGSRSHRL